MEYSTFQSIEERILVLEKLIKKYDLDDEYKSYLVSPLLKELNSLINKSLEDKEAYSLKNMTHYHKDYLLIASSYKRMGRMSLAALFHEKALDIALNIYQEYQEVMNDLEGLFYNILRERNFYLDDQCVDVLKKVQGIEIIEEEKITKLYQDVMKHPRNLKHDPIEMSEEYLAVIDEVEEKIDKSRSIFGLGACHEIWMLKARYLREKGIDWKDPHILNPRVLFD